MELKKVTDLSYAERTILAEFRLCSETDKAEIRAQMQSLLTKQALNRQQTAIEEQEIKK